MANAPTIIYVSEKVLGEMKAELESLKTVSRKDIAEKIKSAMEFGDLSENAEYDEARNEQATLEARISELSAQIKFSKVFDEKKEKHKGIFIGSKIELHDLSTKKVHDLTIVTTGEVDPFEGKISNESPMGKAIVGKKAGDKVVVKSPFGDVEYLIKKAS